MAKTIEVNGTTINCDHEVVTDPKTHQVVIHHTFEADGKSIEHHQTIGADDQPLPAGFDQAKLQEVADAFRQRHAALLESKLRAAKIASSLD